MKPSGSPLIREFAIDDHERAVKFWSNIEGVTLNESDTKEAIRSFLDRNAGLSAIATDESNEIVGTVLCGHNGRAGFLYHLAVAKDRRGQGLGRELVRLCFRKLAAANIPRCNIFVYSDNEAGNQFWMKDGWIDPTSWKVLQKHVVL